MRDAQRHIPLTIRDDTGRQRYAKGGLAKHAEKVKGAGRFGDDMIVHINRDEFEELRRAWGEPTINPETGQPEYFLSGLRKWFSENPIASAVLPAATSILLPGLGSTVGNALNFGGALGNYAGTVGNALVGAGLGGLTGGGTGALIGAASGALAPSVAGMFGFGGPGATGGAAGTGLRDSNIATTNGVTGGNAAAGGAGKVGAGLFGNMSPEKMLIAMGGLGTIASAFHKQKDPAKDAALARNAAAEAQFNKPLPQVSFNRQRTDPGDVRRYGMQGQPAFFVDNQLPTVQAAAQGGSMRSERTMYEQAHAKLRQADAASRPPVRETRDMKQIRDWRSMEAVRAGEETGYAKGGLSQAGAYVQGPGTGRTDEIPALLSDGEYVIDAETVAMLGDGSNKAGAQRLDKMREAVRSHKGKALAKGKFSPNAKDPTRYLGGLSRVGK